MRVSNSLTCASGAIALLLPIGPATLAIQTTGAAPAALRSTVVAQQMMTVPLAFTMNKGQWNEQVVFQARCAGMTIWFTRDGVTCQSIRHLRPQHGLLGRIPTSSRPWSQVEAGESATATLERNVIRSRFENANPHPDVVGEGRLQYACNYLIGNDPARWHTSVPNFNRIVYRDLYPGIDLAFYGKDGALEYDFIVHPGADPAAIALQYDGALSASVGADGDLVLLTPQGELTHKRPRLYQILPDGDRQPISGGFCVSDDGTVRVEVSENRNPMQDLVIDPVLSYSTFLGASGTDCAQGIAVDASGCAYVTGYTESSGFPMQNPYDSTFNGGNLDGFVTKLAATGNSLVYSTFLGGSSDDYGNGIAVDASGSAYVAGKTRSSDFPTQNPYDGSFNGGGDDAFVAKLSGAGDSLVYCTYLGGSSGESAQGVAVDPSGEAYMVGLTKSADFPTQNPYQNTLSGESDVFVTKLSAAGDSLIYSTFLGGTQEDLGAGIALDTSGNAYVAGQTISASFPVQNAFDATGNGGADAFVSKLSTAGDSLLYSTFLGGSNDDKAIGIAVEASGSAYLSGITRSAGFPTQNAYDSTFNGGLYDCFVTKLSPAGSSLVYSTFLGGSGPDEAFGIAVDASGSAYVTGIAASNDFPTRNPYDGGYNDGGADIFVTKLSPSGSSLAYSTFLGGSGADEGMGIAVDASKSVYVAGATSSTDFPVRDAFDSSYSGGSLDAIVTKFSCNCPYQGDLNGDGVLDVFDVMIEIDVAFSGYPDPQDSLCPITRGDVDNSGVTDVADVVYLTATVFSNGANPVNPCES